LQIDTDLLVTITSTADELSGGTNIDDLERTTLKYKKRVLVNFFAISGCDPYFKSNGTKITLNRCCLMSIRSDLLLCVLYVYNLNRESQQSI